MLSIKGIHHITAIASNPKQTLYFYTNILGLRLVKKTVNQDEVSAYHLFFGDTTGEPGMDLTFFIFKGLRQGLVGAGQVSKIRFAINQSAYDFWKQRLIDKDIKAEETKINDIKRLSFKDPDGLRLELASIPLEEFKKGAGKVWESPEINQELAIGYFYGAELSVTETNLIQPVLVLLGYMDKRESGVGGTFVLPNLYRAKNLSVVTAKLGHQGSGTIHHMAFSVKDQNQLLSVRDKLIQAGLNPTQVIDRYYFQSIYFMTPAGILFELATLKPGFTADESEDMLGERLSLPPFLEPHRKEIERNLDPL